MAIHTAVELEGPSAFRVVDRAELPVPPGWAVVRVSYTGVCGSDFPIVDGTHPRARLPLVIGHEITGAVEDPGAGTLAVGTRVAVNPLLSCGECAPCLRGLGHVCRRLGLLGIDAPGSLATFVAAPAQNLVPFRPGVDPLEAALAEPLAVAVHAVRRSRLARGERALVFGAGPIGILVALVARRAGAAVVVAEPTEARRDAARTLGLEVVAPSDVPRAASADDGADVVFDCAGHPSVAAQTTEAAAVRGRIVVVAVHHGPVPLDLRALSFAEQEIIGVRVYEPADFVGAVRLIDEGALGLDRIPVSVHPLADAAAAVAEARSGGSAIKILVQS